MMSLRQQIRYQKRKAKAQAYAAVGLNGKRAVDRRSRQIRDGTLRAANGLVWWDDPARVEQWLEAVTP